MSVWIGSLAGMVETECLSGLQVDPQDRTVHAGGPGTLSGPRAVVWGSPYRVWSASIGVAAPGEMAALETLEHLQRTRGQSYRMLACEAHHTNALTPAASIDFSGWSGTFSPSVTYSAVAEEVGGGTVLIDSTVLYDRTVLEDGTGPVGEVRSTVALTVTPESSGTVLSSPIVPVIPGGPLTLGIFAAGTPSVRATWIGFDGEPQSTVTLGEASHGTTMRRLALSTTAPVDARGVRLAVTGGTRYAWPSITWTAGPRRYATGRGAEAVALSPIPEDLILATAARQLSSFRYVVREVQA